MKKPIVFLIVALLFVIKVNAQFVAEHAYAKDTRLYIGNFQSGKKYVIYGVGTSALTEMRLYNMDYSLWRVITCPRAFANYTFGPEYFYISEKLFNLDTLLEAVVSTTVSPNQGRTYIFNENGTYLDSFSGGFSIHNTAPGVYKMILTTDSMRIFLLPGTIPCADCSSPLGIAKVNKKKRSSLLSDPAPNPSSQQVRVAYTLPEGTKEGVLDIYNSNGKKIRSFRVDNHFSYIQLDNSELPSGIYYYNLIADGEVSATKKMLVIK